MRRTPTACDGSLLVCAVLVHTRVSERGGGRDASVPSGSGAMAIPA
jgi:hypothetical protein